MGSLVFILSLVVKHPPSDSCTVVGKALRWRKITTLRISPMGIDLRFD
jgi:hypothetical protein